MLDSLQPNQIHQFRENLTATVIIALINENSQYHIDLMYHIQKYKNQSLLNFTIAEISEAAYEKRAAFIELES